MTGDSPLLVALDVGTGSVRAHLVAPSGRLVRSTARCVPLDTAPDGRAELASEAVWDVLLTLLPELLAGVAPGRLAALGAASALGYLLVDEAGEPLGPALLWMDRRANAEAEELAGRPGADLLYRITGRRLDPEIYLAKLLWLRRHEPERFSRARAFIGIKDDIIRRLTGVVGSDVTHAAYSMLFDVRARAWSEEILQATGLPRTLLPTLRRGPDVAGRVSAEGARRTGLPAGLPVVTCASDGTAACLAAGLALPQCAVNVTGTSDVVMAAAAGPLFDPEQRLLVNPHPVGPGFMLGGILGTTGGTLKWFVERFCPDLTGEERYRLLDAEAAAAGTGAGGLLCLPGLTGERAPLWDAAARAAFVGMDLGHGRGELARAILEGVALGVGQVADRLRALGADIRRLRVVGGGSRSDLWNQIRADVTGLPVERPRLHEGTVAGITLMTGLGVGLYRDLEEAARAIAPVEATYQPDPERHAAYRRLADLRLRMYEGLRPLFPDLAAFRR